LVKSTRITEEYRRFAFADIQAVVVTELPESQVTQFVGVLAALLWTALAGTVTSTFGRGFFLVTGLWLVTLAVINLARGQRCRCHLYTAVSRELLTPVRRVRTARAFLARIRPEIDAVQGTLPADGEVLTQAPEAPATGQPPEVPRPAIGYAMEILFGLILLDAILIPLVQRFPNLNINNEASSGQLITFVCEIAFAIFVLFRRPAHDPRRVGFVLAGVALACMAADMFGLGRSAVNWFQELMLAAQRQQTTPPPFVWAGSTIWLYFAFGWRVFVGLAGLAAARMERPKGPEA
jgi:hypothetical protein